MSLLDSPDLVPLGSGLPSPEPSEDTPGRVPGIGLEPMERRMRRKREALEGIYSVLARHMTAHTLAGNWQLSNDDPKRPILQLGSEQRSADRNVLTELFPLELVAMSAISRFECRRRVSQSSSASH